MRILLLRHGRTEYNDQRRYQGQLDIPLSARGEAEIFAAPDNPGEVFVSPLRRARRTAELMFPAARQTAVDELKEMDFGVFDGRTAEEMENDTRYRAWVEGGCTGRCPGGEARADFCTRVCGAFERLIERAAADGREILAIVAHGGTQRAVMERFALPRQDYFTWMSDNACGYELAFDAALWQREKRLTVVKTLCFTRAGEQV